MRSLPRSLSLTLSCLLAGGLSAAAGGCGHTAPLAPQTPNRPAATLSDTFVSEHYDYSLALPGGPAKWVESQALTIWAGDTPSKMNPAFDRIYNAQNNWTPWVWVAAEPVPTGMTLENWASFLVSITNPGCTYAQQTFATTKLGSAKALRFTLSCADGGAGMTIQLAAIHDHRGYFFIYGSGAPELQDSDWSAFNTWRQSFQFVNE